MPRKIYINGAGLAHQNISMSSLLSSFSGTRQKEAQEKIALKELLPGAKLRRVPHAALMALEAAALALRDAGRPTVFADSCAPRAGIFTGSAHCCVEASFSFMDSIIDFGAKLSSPTAFSLSVNNVFTGMLSLYLNTQGPSYTACQFGASFAGALSAAGSSLMSGGCDLALVGAVEEKHQLLSKVYTLGNNVAVHDDIGWERPESDCALFFALSTERGENGIEIDLPIWQPDKTPAADLYFSALSSGKVCTRNSAKSCVLDCRSLYETGPAMQAWDLTLAYAALRDGLLPDPAFCHDGALPQTPQSAVCECFSNLTEMYSAISLHRS